MVIYYSLPAGAAGHPGHGQHLPGGGGDRDQRHVLAQVGLAVMVMEIIVLVILEILVN